MAGTIQVMVPHLLRNRGFDPSTMSISAFSRWLDVSWPTAEALLRTELTQIQFKTLVKLCEFFEIDDVGKILKYVPESGGEH